MNDAVMTMDHVSKSYKRKGTVLQDVSLSVPQGSVTALVGRNGVGKSTLMSLATGFLTPDAGTIDILGAPPSRQSQMPGVSYMAQHKPLLNNFTVDDMLMFGRKMNDRWDGVYATKIIDDAHLSPKTRIGALSAGERTQVALALALGRRPQLLLLDEPLASLDPIARKQVTGTLMADVAEHGTSIIMSSHIVAELETMCDRILLLNNKTVQIDSDIETFVGHHYLADGKVARGKQECAADRQELSLEEIVLAYLEQGDVK